MVRLVIENLIPNYIFLYIHQSTLLQCLLRELPVLSGTVIVKGSVGYASQEAWVFSATLRENILFGLPYEPDRYETVIEACALNKVLTRRHFWEQLTIFCRILSYYLKVI